MPTPLYVLLCRGYQKQRTNICSICKIFVPQQEWNPHLLHLSQATDRASEVANKSISHRKNRTRTYTSGSHPPTTPSR